MPPVRVGEEQIRCARRGLDRFWFGSSVGFRLTRAFLRCCGPLSEFISSRRLGEWTSPMWGYRARRICALFAHVDRCEMRRCCRPNGFACPLPSPVYMCSSVAPDFRSWPRQDKMHFNFYSIVNASAPRVRDTKAQTRLDTTCTLLQRPHSSGALSLVSLPATHTRVRWQLYYPVCTVEPSADVHSAGELDHPAHSQESFQRSL